MNLDLIPRFQRLKLSLKKDSSKDYYVTKTTTTTINSMNKAIFPHQELSNLVIVRIISLLSKGY